MAMYETPNYSVERGIVNRFFGMAERALVTQKLIVEKLEKKIDECTDYDEHVLLYKDLEAEYAVFARIQKLRS